MGLFDKIKAGLQKTAAKLGHELKRIVTGSPKLTGQTVEQLEHALLGADLGMAMTQQILSAVKKAYESQGSGGLDVFAIAKCESPGRPHVARALVQAGLCSSMDEAFERFLKKHRPAWVPKFKISAYDAVALIHHAGGVAVIAHPALNKSDDIIPALVAAGIDGIECFHTRHSTAASEHYMLMAEQYGLAITGGSDCHGMNKGRPLMGGIKLPVIHVRQLEARARAIREKSLLAA